MSIERDLRKYAETLAAQNHEPLARMREARVVSEHSVEARRDSQELTSEQSALVLARADEGDPMRKRWFGYAAVAAAAVVVVALLVGTSGSDTTSVAGERVVDSSDGAAPDGSEGSELSVPQQLTNEYELEILPTLAEQFPLIFDDEGCTVSRILPNQADFEPEELEAVLEVISEDELARFLAGDTFTEAELASIVERVEPFAKETRTCPVDAPLESIEENQPVLGYLGSDYSYEDFELANDPTIERLPATQGAAVAIIRNGENAGEPVVIAAGGEEQYVSVLPLVRPGEPAPFVLQDGATPLKALDEEIRLSVRQPEAQVTVIRAIEITPRPSRDPNELVLVLNNRSTVELSVVTVFVSFFNEDGQVAATVSGQSDRGEDAIERLIPTAQIALRLTVPESARGLPYDAWAFGLAQ
jgi:hypothetical protein